MKITVWTLPNCVQCQQTKKQFDLMGIRYVEELLDSNPFKLDEFRAKGLLTAPIVETDTKVWAGFRLDKIRSLAAHLKSLGETEPKPDETPGEATREFYRKQGEQRAIDRIALMLANSVCFDYRDNGGCTHSECYNNTDLMIAIKGNK